VVLCSRCENEDHDPEPNADGTDPFDGWSGPPLPGEEE
jgi:hypothetical protein